MRFELRTGNIMVIHSPNGEEMIWQMGGYLRAKMASSDTIFRDINDYFSRLSLSRQTAIWNAYSEIYKIIKRVTSVKTMTDRLIIAIERLYVVIQIPEIATWVRKYGNVVYPQSVSRVVHDEDDTNPNRTYLQSDYAGLVVLSVALRPMVPVWGEYMMLIRRRGEDIGPLHKEYTALKLLSRSAIIDSPQVERLTRYLEASFASEIDITSVILTTFSSSEIITWLLALVLVRRLSVGKTDTDDNNKSGIISNIHTYVDHTIKGLDKRFGDYRDKHKTGTSDDESNSSRLDAYRVRQTLSIGESAIFTVYAEKAKRMAKRIDPTIPSELRKECVAQLYRHYNTPIKDEHITLVQWVCAAILPPRSIPLLHRNSLLNAMAVTQAALFHWGFLELAHLITAEGARHSDNVVNVRDDKSKAVINNVLTPLIKELDTYYPYSLVDHTTKRSVNPAYASVVRLVSGYSQCDWHSQAPSIITDANPALVGGDNKIKIDVDLTASLISLIILINQRAEKCNHSETNNLPTDQS